MNQHFPFLQLPSELQFRIFDNLNYKELKPKTVTCKLIQAIIEEIFFRRVVNGSYKPGKNLDALARISATRTLSIPLLTIEKRLIYSEKDLAKNGSLDIYKALLECNKNPEDSFWSPDHAKNTYPGYTRYRGMYYSEGDPVVERKNLLEKEQRILENLTAGGKRNPIAAANRKNYQSQINALFEFYQPIKLETIAAIKAERLEIKTGKISNNDFQKLCEKLPPVKHLSIENNLSPAQLISLFSMQSWRGLQTLEISNISLPLRFLKNKKLATLSHLKLHQCTLDNEQMEMLVNPPFAFTKLKRLAIDNFSVSSLTLQKLFYSSQFPALSKLEAHFSEISPAFSDYSSFPEKFRLKKLKELSISGGFYQLVQQIKLHAPKILVKQ